MFVYICSLIVIFSGIRKREGLAGGGDRRKVNGMYRESDQNRLDIQLERIRIK